MTSRARTGVQLSKAPAAAAPARATQTAPPSVESVIASPGAALDPEARIAAETHFGHDFSRIRVHSDPAAAKSAEDVGAEAYTVGQHIVFNENRYSPRSAEGRSLLTHELTHTIQQEGAARTSSIPIGSPHAPAEAEAQRASTQPARDPLTLRREPKKKTPAAPMFNLDPDKVPGKLPLEKDFVWTRMDDRSDHDTKLDLWKNGDEKAFDGAFDALYGKLTPASFLGHAVANNAHPDMVPVLKAADAELASLGIDDAALKKRGYPISGIGGGGKRKGSLSYHTLGLAIDIDSNPNPFVMGENAEGDIDKEVGPVSALATAPIEVLARLTITFQAILPASLEA